MKKTFIYLLLFVVSSCVSIRSNVKKENVPKFTNILVVLKMKVASDEQAAKFLKVFPARYTVCAMAYDELSFENLNDKTNEYIQLCKSEVILKITTTQKGHSNYDSFGNSSNTAYEYFAEMSDISNQNVFWKAQITNTHNMEDFNPKAIVNRLILDGIISK